MEGFLANQFILDLGLFGIRVVTSSGFVRAEGFLCSVKGV